MNSAFVYLRPAIPVCLVARYSEFWLIILINSRVLLICDPASKTKCKFGHSISSLNHIDRIKAKFALYSKGIKYVNNIRIR